MISIIGAAPARAASGGLESQIDKYIKDLRRTGGIAADERTAWSIYDFTTGEKLVDINEDRSMQAASLIKPFIMLAFFHEVERGRFIYGPKSKSKMETMICDSNNNSTNWAIKTIGGPARVQSILKQNYGRMLQDISIVEYIPGGGATYKNKASAHDYSRFLFALWKGTLPYSKEMRRIMSLPGRDRLVDGVDGIPRKARVLDKTGSTARLCGQMGIITLTGSDGKKYSYTLVGIIEKDHRAKDYGTWIRARSDVIRDISEIVYKYMKARYRAL